MLSREILKPGLTMIMFFLTLCLQAQTLTEDSLEQKLSRYNKTNINSALYLTTDKTLYLPTEVVWFAGYILDGTAVADSLKPDILSVALVGEDAVIKLRKNYLIADNISSGSLSLTDSIQPGNYQLVAYTNILNSQGEPKHTFRAPLTIKSVTTPPFTVNFNTSDKFNNDSLFVDVRVYLADGRLATGKGNSSIQYHLLNQKTRKAPLNKLGIATLGLPLYELKNSNGILYTTTTFKGITRDFNFHLPVQTNDSIRAKFYPEGGDMVIAQLNRVAWETISSNGNPITNVKAFILENGIMIDTIHTDSLGIGVFTLKPKSNSVYTMETARDKMISQTFALPTPLQQGTSLEIKNAVTTDTLSIGIKASKAESVQIVVANMLTNATVITPPIAIEKNKRVVLPLDKIEKGLNILTLLNQQGLPVAERLFFAHFDKKADIKINKVKDLYKPKEKITAAIAITDTDGNRLGSVITVSCVHLSRLNSSFKRNIQSYFYAEHWLDAEGRLKPIGNFYQNKSYLEKLLLVKGWRRYTWQRIMESKSDTVALLKKLNVEGSISYADPKAGKIRKLEHVFVLRDAALSILSTDKKGHFYPKAEEISLAENKNISFKVEGSKASDFVVLLKDPMEKIKGKFLQPVNNSIPLSANNQQSSKEQQLAEQPFSQTMETVTVKARQFNYAEGYESFGVNSCGDYICRNGIFNCQLHRNEPDNRSPIKGKSYIDASSRFPIIYKGCTTRTDNFFGIYTAREFYGVDSSSIGNQDSESYLSTLYWKPVSILSGNQKNSFQFYSSDLPGRYRITIEGIAGNGELLYQEKYFEVRKEDDKD